MTLAEKVTSRIGSWMFLNVQTIALAMWILWNTIFGVWLGFRPFDPFPFVFLNLTLSFQAAYTGPIVLMAQYAQAKRDAKRDAKMEQVALNTETMMVQVGKHTEALLELARQSDERESRSFEMLAAMAETIKQQTILLNHMATILTERKEEYH